PPRSVRRILESEHSSGSDLCGPETHTMRRRTAGHPSPRFRPRVETLEGRCLPSAGPFTSQPVVPVIDVVTQAHLQAILASGQQQGNRADVFAKVGDSNTAWDLFLDPLGEPAYNPADPALVGANAGLAPTIDFFRAQPVDGTGANSFDRVSLSA